MIVQSEVVGATAILSVPRESPVPGLGEVDSEALALMDQFLAEHPGRSERLMPLLHLLQRRLGYLPLAVQAAVAERLALAPVQVSGVVSFYNHFTTVPRGRCQVKVCTGTACFVRGSERLLDTLQDLLQVEVGGITDDGAFNLEHVRCIGACGLAPAIMVNDAVHGNLTLPKLRRLLQRLRVQARSAERAEAERKESGS